MNKFGSDEKQSSGIRPFKLERYFALYEFNVPNGLLSCSDAESVSMHELRTLANTESHTPRQAQAQLAWNKYESMSFHYTESEGNPELRQLIADLYSTDSERDSAIVDSGPDSDLSVTSDNVLVCVPEEGIFCTMMSVLEPGDHIICTYPCYQSLYEVARSRNCTVTAWELEEKNGVWHFDVDALDTLMRKAHESDDDTSVTVTVKTKMIVINTPHNPTGAMLTHDEWTRVVRIAEKYDCYLFSDEMYRFSEHDPALRLPSACQLYRKAIVLCGLSKSWGMPGLRIGWIITHDDHARKAILNSKDYTTICPSGPSEMLAIVALHLSNALLARTQQIIAENVPQLEQFLKKYSHVFKCCVPKVGTMCFARIVHPDAQSAYDFCDAFIKEAGIMLLPSECMDMPANEPHVRFGFGRRAFVPTLHKLGEYLDKHFAP
jgi:aspartate/methionine/tyrosine aminotransferase